jgi:hypothetical protein
MEDEEKELVPLGSAHLNNPASLLASNITKTLQQLLVLVSDCHDNTKVI